MKKKILGLLLTGIMAFAPVQTSFAADTWDFSGEDFSDGTAQVYEEPAAEEGVPDREDPADPVREEPEINETEAMDPAEPEIGPETTDDGMPDADGSESRTGDETAGEEQMEAAGEDPIVEEDLFVDGNSQAAAAADFSSDIPDEEEKAAEAEPGPDETEPFGSALPGDEAAVGDAGNSHTDYDLPLADRTMLPYWDHRIDKVMHGWHVDDDHPEGVDIETAIKDVQLTQDQANPSFQLEKTDEGWRIMALTTPGSATVTVTYIDYDTGKNVRYEARFTVGADVYDVSVNSSDGFFRIFPGDRMTLQAEVYWHCYDMEERYHYEGDVSALDCTWKWVLPSHYQDIISLRQDPDDPSKAVVTAKDTDGWREAWIEVQLLKDGKVISTGYFRLDVAHGGYSNLTPSGLDFDTSLLKAGESFTLSPSVINYWQEGSTTLSETEKNVRFMVGFNENQLEIKAGDALLRGGETLYADQETGSVLLEITRKYPHEIRFSVVAQVQDDEGNWFEIDGRQYRLGDTDTEIRLEGNLNEWGNLDLFDNGGEEILTLNTDNLGDLDYRLVWSVGRDNANDTITPVNGFYTISQDQKQITFDPEKAWNILKGEGVHLRVQVMWQDEEITRTDCWIQSKLSEYHYQWSDGEVVLPGWEMVWDHELLVDVYDRNHPNGDLIRLQVQDMTLENENPDEPAMERSLTEDGNWLFKAVNYGRADVTMTFTDIDGTVRTHTFPYFVDGDRYEVWIKYERDNDQLAPGAKTTVTAHVEHLSMTGRGQIQTSNENLTYKWEIQDDSKGLISGKTDTKDPSVFIVTAGKENGRANIRLVVYDLDNSGNRIEVADRWFGFNIHPNYAELLPQSIDGDRIPAGGTVKVTPVYREYWMDENGKEQSRELNTVRYLWEYDPEYIEIKDSSGKVVGNYNGNGEYVHTPASEGKGATFTIRKKKHFDGQTNIRLLVERKERGEWTRDGWTAMYFVSGHCMEEVVIEKATYTQPQVTKLVCKECGIDMSCPIHGEKLVKTTKITVPSKKVTVKVGKTVQLAPTLTPANSTDGISYKSSAPKVATVSDNGVVTGVRPGTAKITITSGKKSVTVKVTVPDIKTTKITVPSKKVTVKKGKKITLKPTVKPANSTQAVTFSSSDKKIATVSKKGVVKGVRAGKAKITITSGSKSVVVVVTVK